MTDLRTEPNARLLRPYLDGVASSVPTPERGLDEILAAVATTPQQHRSLPPPPTWRFQSMFSATKFVVAGVFVASFGGLLLSGVMTQPSEEQMPVVGASASAQTESTSVPTTAPEATASPEVDTVPPANTTVSSDFLPGVNLTTEEVEPGVLRIVNDGVRDLTWAPDSANPYDVLRGGVVVGLDGSVWNVIAESPDRPEFYRLGDSATHRAKGLGRMQVDRDGRPWAFFEPSGGRLTLRSYDGETWKVRRDMDRRKTFGWDKLETGADGAVWVSWPTNGGTDPNGYAIGRWAPGAGWSVGLYGTKKLPDGEPNDAVLRLSASLGGDQMYLTSDRRFARVKGIGDGRYKLGPMVDPPVHRIYHQGAWVRQGGLAATDDGTIWVDGKGRDGERVLARTTNLDDLDAWKVFDVAPSPSTKFPDLGPVYPNLAGVAADGSAWLHGWFDRGDCDGIHRFDGSTWTTFLAGSCPLSVDFAADGAVWLQAGNDGTVSSYVITTEAMAATD